MKKFIRQNWFKILIVVVLLFGIISINKNFNKVYRACRDAEWSCDYASDYCNDASDNCGDASYYCDDAQNYCSNCEYY